MAYLLFAVGLGLLLWGADRLVLGASALARHFGVSTIVISVVVVGFGTSVPEMLTSLDAALQGSPDLAIANVVGSNIANVLLVIGLSALCLPLHCDPGSMRRDIWVLFGASLLSLLALQHGVVERWMGVVLFGALVGYLWLLIRTSRTSPVGPGNALGESLDVEESPPSTNLARQAWSTAGAITVLLVGAHLLVSGALDLATQWGVPQSVIGLSLVAFGTSMPELAVAALSLVRRSADVAVGNIVGSILFNLLGVLGLTAIVIPLAVPIGIATFDIWVMVAAMVVLAVFSRSGWRITRVEGAALLAAYPVYILVHFG